MSWIPAILLVIALYLASFVVGYFVYRFSGSGEAARKTVHFLAVLVSIGHLFLFESLWQSFISGAIMFFSLLVLRFIRPGFFLYRVKRKSLGELFLILGMAIPVLFGRDRISFSIIALLVLGISDSLAALIGSCSRKPSILYNGKTVLGSFTFLVSCGFFVFGGFILTDGPLSSLTFLRLLCLVLSVTLSEAVASRGFDNITVPLGTYLLLLAAARPDGLFGILLLGFNVLSLVMVFVFGHSRKKKRTPALMRRRVSRLFLRIHEYRTWLLMLFALFAILSIGSITLLFVDNSLESWFSAGSVELEEYDDFLQRYGSDDALSVVCPNDLGIDFRSLGRALEEVPEVNSVIMMDAEDSRMLVLQMTDSLRDAEDLQRCIGEVEAILSARIPKGAYNLAGVGLLFAELNRLSSSDGFQLAFISMLVSTAILYLRYRNPLRVLFCLMIIGFNLLICMALYAVLGSGINMVTMILPSLVLTYSLCDIIHLLNHTDRAIANGAESRQAFHSTFALAPYPCGLTSLTTAAGFLALVISPIPVIRDLGRFAALFILVSYISSMILYAALFSIPFRHRTAPAASAIFSRAAGRIFRGGSRRVTVIGILLLLTASAGIFRLRVDTFSMGFLRKDNPIRKSSRVIEETWGNYVPLDFLVTLGEEGLSNRNLSRLNMLIETTLKSGVADQAFTLFSVYNRVGFPDNPLSAEFLAGQISKDRREQWLSSDRREVRISFRIPMDSARGFRDRIEGIQAGSDLNMRPAGYIPLYVHMMESITRTQVHSFLIAFLVVFLLILLMSRSAALGLSAVVANLLPLSAVLGIMGWTGVRIDISTSTLAAVSMGIIVDDTIHIIDAYRRSSGNFQDAFETVGSALLTTTVVLAAGFSVLAFARVNTISRFGLFMALIIVMAFLGDTVLLPKGVSLLRLRRHRHAG